MTFCEKADMQNTKAVLQFWLFLLIQGSRKRDPKTGERATLKTDNQKSRKWLLGGPIWRLLGLFLATFLHVSFRSKTGHFWRAQRGAEMASQGGLKKGT